MDLTRNQEEGIDGGLEVANPSAHGVHQTGAQGVDASVGKAGWMNPLVDMAHTHTKLSTEFSGKHTKSELENSMFC